MPNPRISDAEKKRRGTYRPDRSENLVKPEPKGEADKALAQYKEIANEVLGRAIKGADVTEDIAYLRAAESALQNNGIVAFTGQRWNLSTLADLMQQAREAQRER